MAILAFPLAIAVATTLPATQTFWRPEPGPALQPAQVQVESTLIHQGTRVAAYQQVGYTPAVDSAQVVAALRDLDESVLPRLESLYGPLPDRDGNGVVLILIAESSVPGAEVFPFDFLDVARANRHGLHSNHGEIIYHSFAYGGNRAAFNQWSLAEAAYRILHLARYPGATAWSRWMASYVPFHLGQTSARWLWGDTDPHGRSFLPHDPWSTRGWSLLFLHYLRERLGEDALPALQGARSLPEFTFEWANGLVTGADLLGDFAMACWLDDLSFASGRFGFSSVDPPRPLAAARAQASRPLSGLLQVGGGGTAYLVIEGSGERSFPVTLQGDPEASWSGRAVLVRQRGPDEELPLIFGERALAKLDLPVLNPDEVVVVAVAAHPADAPGWDRRVLPLHWGVGWVPHSAVDDAPERLSAAVQKVLPDGGKAARESLGATLARLTGRSTGQGPAITTRYAFAPESGAVVEVIREEVERRGLRAEVMPFAHRSPAGIEQQWQNILVELPGGDPRRWPVVVAAHWDAVRGDAEESSARALSASDNAAGVATVIEIASALSRRARQTPVLVAFLAGGHADAAGAAALITARQGRFTAWIELDEVGIPQRGTRANHLRLEAAKQIGRLPLAFQRAAKDVGLVARVHEDVESSHTGVPLAIKRGIPALAIRSRTPQDAAQDAELPLSVECARVSHDLLALVAKATADAVTVVSGGR